MSVHLIVQLLVLAGEAKSAGELVDQFETLLGSYKFNFYELSLRAKPETGESEHILAARMPENWRQVYAAKRYGLVDPVRVAPAFSDWHRMPRATVWSTVMSSPYTGETV